jgi:hypothetical protein
MESINYIKASANVTRVTSLTKGDVYKRLEDSSYSDDKLLYGIVLDVLYNGSDAVVQAMEFKPSYSSMETSLKTFAGDKDIKIVPANQDEISEYLKSCVSGIRSDVEAQKKKLAEAEDKLREAKKIVSGDLVKKLTTPTYTNTALPATTADSDEDY